MDVRRKGGTDDPDRRHGRNVSRSAVYDLTLRHLSEDGREQREHAGDDDASVTAPRRNTFRFSCLICMGLERPMWTVGSGPEWRFGSLQKRPKLTWSLRRDSEKLFSRKITSGI
jgi:hypothetical protein